MEAYQVEVSGLRLFGYHGVFEEERTLGQEFQLDLWLEVETPSLSSDQVKNIVNYGEVAQQVKEVFDARPYSLIEALADAILSALSRFSGLKSAKIRVKKPSPPIPIPLDYVAVTVQRSYTHVT